MAEHGAFAASCRATGVDDGGDILSLSMHRRMHIAVVCCALQQTATELLV